MTRPRLPVGRGEVVIVGAGLVGCLAALYLARRGYRVSLFEGRPDPRLAAPVRGRSLHLVISARGWRALDTIGLGDAVRSITLPLRGRTVHVAGGTTFHPYDAHEQAIDAVSRDALNQVLLDACARVPTVRIEFGQRLVALDLDTTTLTFEQHETRSRHRVATSRLLAADGAFSAVRLEMLRREHFDYAQHYIPYAYKELTMPGAGASDGPLARHTLHVWPRGQFMLTAFPNLDRTFSATLLLPCSGAPSFETIQSADALLALFRENFADALAWMPNLVSDFFGHPTSSLVSVRCNPWTYGGTTALIGDAAHAMLPFLGQGMNAGFEDVTVLDQCLEHANDDFHAAIDAYQRLRRPDCDTITDLSLAHFRELSEQVADPQFLLQRRIEHKFQRMFPERFVPLYARVAFSCMRYTEIARLAARQDAAIGRIMAVEGLEQRVDSPEIDELIRELALAL